MSRRAVASLLIAMILALGCAAERPVITYEPLGVARAAVGDRLAAPSAVGPFEVELRGGGKVSVRSCTDYLTLPGRPQDHAVGSGPDQRAFCAFGAFCHALQTLDRARPAKRSFLGRDPLALITADHLPAEAGMIVSKADQQSLEDPPKAERSLRSFDPKAKLRRKNTAVFVVDGDWWRGEVLVYGRGDLDADGLEDLLVRRDGSAVGGRSSPRCFSWPAGNGQQVHSWRRGHCMSAPTEVTHQRER